MSNTAPTYAQFIVQYPEFTASPSRAIVEGALSLSSRLLSKTNWGDFYSDAVGLDTAHNLAIKAMAGAAANGSLQGSTGAITSVSGAGISTSFATPSPDMKNKADVWYSKTSYGQQFLLLRDRVILFGMLSI